MSRLEQLKLRIQECDSAQRKLNNLKHEIELQKKQRIAEINELLKENYEIEGQITNTKDDIARCADKISYIRTKLEAKLKILQQFEHKVTTQQFKFDESEKEEVDISEEQEFILSFNQKINDFVFIAHKNLAGFTTDKYKTADKKMTDTIEKLQASNEEMKASLATLDQDIKNISAEIDSSKIENFTIKSQIWRLICGFMIAFIIKLLIL